MFPSGILKASFCWFLCNGFGGRVKTALGFWGGMGIPSSGARKPLDFSGGEGYNSDKENLGKLQEQAVPTAVKLLKQLAR
jgi:hypothetical protein